jgi:hypothetical protein
MQWNPIHCETEGVGRTTSTLFIVGAQWGERSEMSVFGLPALGGGPFLDREMNDGVRRVVGLIIEIESSLTGSYV